MALDRDAATRVGNPACPRAMRAHEKVVEYSQEKYVKWINNESLNFAQNEQSTAGPEADGQCVRHESQRIPYPGS